MRDDQGPSRAACQRLNRLDRRGEAEQEGRLVMQRLVAVGCLIAGVLVLAGLGWALLAAGGLLWLADDRVAVWLTGRWSRLQADVRGRWASAREAPRHALARSMMGMGAVAAPAGALVAAGVGAALIVAAVVLLGLSLLLGWGQ